MSEQREVDRNLRTRQLIVGVILLVAVLALISTANLWLREWFTTTVNYAVVIFVLLLLGRFVRSVERVADAFERRERREENRVE